MDLAKSLISQHQSAQKTTYTDIGKTFLGDKIMNISLENIICNPKNREINLEKVQEYKASIRELGLIEDPVVMEVDDRYMLLSGHHRIAACRLLAEEDPKYRIVRCKVMEKDDLDAELVLIHSNVKNNPLSSYEKMIAIGREEELLKLKEEKGTLRDVIAKNMGLKASQVQTNLTVYKKAIPELKAALKDETVTLEIARNIAVLPKDEQLGKLTNLKRTKKAKTKTTEDIFLTDLKQNITRKLGTKTKITNNYIQISYNGVDDLNRILEILNLLEEST